MVPDPALPFPGASRRCRGSKDCDQFSGLAKENLEHGAAGQAAIAQVLEPEDGFIRLLDNRAYLGCEFGVRSRSGRGAVVGCDRTGGSHELKRRISADQRRKQWRGELSDGLCEGPRTLSQFLWSHASDDANARPSFETPKPTENPVRRAEVFKFLQSHGTH